MMAMMKVLTWTLNTMTTMKEEVGVVMVEDDHHHYHHLMAGNERE